jgi:hypothetical protein
MICSRTTIDAGGELSAYGVRHDFRTLRGKPVEPGGTGLFRNHLTRGYRKRGAPEQFGNRGGILKRAEFAQGGEAVGTRLPAFPGAVDEEEKEDEDDEEHNIPARRRRPPRHSGWENKIVQAVEAGGWIIHLFLLSPLSVLRVLLFNASVLFLFIAV